jgi:hypothetical protein
MAERGIEVAHVTIYRSELRRKLSVNTERRAPCVRQRAAWLADGIGRDDTGPSGRDIEGWLDRVREV